MRTKTYKTATKLSRYVVPHSEFRATGLIVGHSTCRRKNQMGNYQIDRAKLVTDITNALVFDDPGTRPIEEIQVVVNPDNVRVIVSYADATPDNKNDFDVSYHS